jgi:hypothetical protein
MDTPTKKTLPDYLQPLWDALTPEVTWLHGRWIIYRQLFGTSSERIDMLNEAAGTFFYVIQGVLLDEVQLTISKLGDPATTAVRQNLTLAALRQALSATEHLGLCARLDPLLQIFNDRCARIRHRRNKRIAHFDRDTLLKARSAPIEGASRKEIEEALQALRDFLNEIELHLTDSTTGYEHFILHDDGEALVAMIKRGLRYEELARSQRIAWSDLMESPYFRV